MSSPLPGSRALPVRRSRLVDTDQLTAVVVEIDPTAEPNALAVLQAGLHEPPPGRRLVFGYDITPAGLGAWVGDRKVRFTVWPALVDEAGEITTADLDDPDADLLVVDFDARSDALALENLARVGRLIIAGPDAGPIPLVLDVDQALLSEVIATTGD